MPLKIPNLDFLRSVTTVDHLQQLGPKLHEAFQSVAIQYNNLEAQTNGNANGEPKPPPAINALKVTANDGHFQIGINHEGQEFFRGINYHVEHADNPQFINPHPVDLGTARNQNLFLGNATRYFRASASYPGSPPGPWVYHGDGSDPIPVTGGGAIPAPSFQSAQGSGTGTAGQAMQGPGTNPFRSTTGVPPVR